MKLNVAQEVFEVWREYIEFSDKLSKLFPTGLPESLLPFPLETIEDAINTVAEDHFNNGDIETSDLVKSSFNFLTFYSKDADALKQMHSMLNIYKVNKDIRTNALKNLKDASDSWRSFREQRN